MKHRAHPLRFARQRGLAAVEFALIACMFFTLLIGIMEFSRVLFYWNTAAEVTRLAARSAVVCDSGASIIKTRMENMLPILQDSNISVAYSPTGCDSDPATARSTCQTVTVSVSNVTIATMIPVMRLRIGMPTFTTTMTRESMQTSTGGSVCS